MKCHWTVAVLCVFALGQPSHAAGQSLAELARQESARRQAVARGKVITNNDLKPMPPATAAPVTPAPGTTLPPPPALDKALPAPAGAQTAGAAQDDQKTADGKAPADERKDEKYWRQRVATTRDSLSRAQTFQVALEARIAALSTDFVNRDDPAQRAQVATDRLKAMTELDRVKKDILGYQAELSTIVDEARRAGAPAGWVR